MNPVGMMLNMCTVAHSTAANVPSMIMRCRSTSARLRSYPWSSASNARSIRPANPFLLWTTRRKRLQSIGVSVTDTTPEIRIAVVIVTANSRNSRPRIPLMNRIGMNTAASETVIERIVKPISREPLSAAWSGFSPSSMWRTMFSSITIASSTTKPIERISAIIERLLRLKCISCMTANVPRMEKGSASAGMSVADPLWRKRKMTATTSSSVTSIVTCTSWNASRIVRERSCRGVRCADGGSCETNDGRRLRTASVTSIVLLPGCRITISMIDRWICGLPLASFV